MTFQCEKCDKKFERQLYLTRHNERKIPCNRDLTCERCFKEFTQLGHLKNHMSRKFLCDNKKEELLLQKKKIQNKNNILFYILISMVTFPEAMTRFRSPGCAISFPIT